MADSSFPARRADVVQAPPVLEGRPSRLWYLLLVPPFVGLLYPPLYAREHPAIGGLYPHAVTGVLSAKSAGTVRRNAALLPAYSLLLGLMALLGYMTIAAGITPSSPNYAVPDLFLRFFPSWFAGVAFAAIAIGALVPAAIMSIAAANLFTRNIYSAYVRPQADSREQAQVAKIASLVVKVGALAFVIWLPTKYAIDLQLLGGVWILQTLPAIVIGLFTRWLHSWALLAGWAVGMVTGTLMAYSQSYSSIYPLSIGGHQISAYAGVFALAANLAVCVLLTLALRAAGRTQEAQDATVPDDYDDLGPAGELEPAEAAPALVPHAT